MLFTNHKMWAVIFLVGSAILAVVDSPMHEFNVAYMAGWIIGMAFMCAIVAGLAYLISFIVRRRLHYNQVVAVFFGTFVISAGLILVAAIVS